MNTFYNASPQHVQLGIDDNSGGQPVVVPEATPTFLPHIYTFAQKGDTLPELVSGQAMLDIFGAQTFDERSPFFTHQTMLAKTVTGRGGSVMLQRVIPDDAGPKARLLLSADVVEDDIQQYQRNPDGTWRLGVDGLRIPVTGQGATIRGHRVKWVLNQIEGVGNVDAPFGEVPSRVGTLVAADQEQSTLYPIAEFEANFIGSDGNNIGLRLSAPTTASGQALNLQAAEAVKAHLYRLQLVRRENAAASPSVVQTLQSERSLDFTFKRDAVYAKTDSMLSFDDIFLPRFQNLETRGVMPPQYGPFGRAKIYHSNLETLLAQIGEVESEYTSFSSDIDADSDALHEVNLLTAVDFHGVPYHSVQVLDASDGGLRFTDNATFYAAGGSDGTMSFATFDALVRKELNAYGHGEADLLDDAYYTQSCLIDTGFTLETKYAFYTPMARRKDIWVAVSTQDISLPQNGPAEESSIAIALRSRARNFPESEIYGTSVCRAVVIGHSGYLIGSRYKGLLPLTIELADKCANYMGAANGEWAPGLGLDMPPNNQITMFRDVNATFKNQDARARDWDNGLVWAQKFDRASLFWPAVQTVYDDDSSILNGFINMVVAVDLQKVTARVWRELTGISSLSPEQFADRSDRLILDKTASKYDGRVTVVPETTFTADDTQRGYSWTTKAKMYGENMRSVGVTTIESLRRSDLGVAA